MLTDKSVRFQQNIPIALLKMTNVKSHLLVLLATIIVAGSFLASENLAGIISPFSLTLLRFAGASVLLIPVIIYKKRWRDKVMTTLPRAIVISFFYAAFFIGWFESLNTTTALNTGTLFTLVPLITALLAAILLREKMNRRQLFVYLIGASGAIWIIFGGQLEQFLLFSLSKGDLIFLLAAVSMCCYSVSMKLLYRDDEMIVLVFCTLLGGSFWMVLALLLTGQPLEWHLIQSDSALNMAYLIIGATLITVYLYQKTTVALGPARVNAYIYLNPAFVAILLFLIDGVSIPMEILPGFIISLMATMMLQKNNDQESTAIPVKKTR